MTGLLVHYGLLMFRNAYRDQSDIVVVETDVVVSVRLKIELPQLYRVELDEDLTTRIGGVDMFCYD